MSTSSSSVHSELSASVPFVVASSASAQYEDEGFDEESSSLIAPAVQEGQEEQGKEDGANETAHEYDDDAFEDDLESTGGDLKTTRVLVVDASSASSREGGDDYGTDHFEEDEDATCSQAGAETPQLQQHEDERAFASYGEESFEIEDASASALLRSGHEAQAEERELERMTIEDRDTEAQARTDSCMLSLRYKRCADKIKTLTARKVELAPGFLATSPAHTLPIEACQALQRQLLRKSKQTSGARDSTNARVPRACRSRSSNRSVEGSAQLPSEFLEKMLSNAKNKHLLHAQFDHMVVSEPEPEREQTSPSARATNQKCLSTFCAVKRADLEGKLATINFEDQWSRSCTNHASKPNGMSIETLEIVQEMVAKQREILHAGTATKSEAESGGDNLFSCMKTRAPNLDHTVESTQRCLEESRMLREQAQRLLRPRSQAQVTTAR